MLRLRVRVAVVLGLLTLPVVVACSVVIRRDLSALPAGQVGFDDMCGLQEYFDALEIKTSPPPRVVSSLDLEGLTTGPGGKPVRGGTERFAFENDFQLKHARRVLNENWQRLPERVPTASKIEIEVKWAEKAGTRRVITDEAAALTVGDETVALPYHVCLSELLYGEPLYRQRRVMWRLPLPDAGGAAATGAMAAADGGSPDGARRDGGAADAGRDVGRADVARGH
jgi:hypothetical protein